MNYPELRDQLRNVCFSERITFKQVAKEIGITVNTLRGIICPKKKLCPKMYSRTVMRIKKWLEIKNDAL